VTYTFTNRPIGYGRYEPEGIYLNAPFAGLGPIVQTWGESPDYYGQFTYNGVPLRGYIGIGFAIPVGTQVLAVDDGRVMETGHDRDGFGRYIKLDHGWGESFMACLQHVHVESGQTVSRHDCIGASGRIPYTKQARLHFGIRIHPYNRFDGWGGFTNPLPFLDPTCIDFPDTLETTENGSVETISPLPIAAESAGMRRP